MAQQFTRYVGYDSPEAFRGFLMDIYAAARKRGLFYTDRLAMASTTEISAAAPYTAASYDDPAAIKQGLDAWLRSVHITCDSAAIAQVMVKALEDCGVNKKNTYFVILCWLMKFLAAKPQLFVFVGAANLRELYLMYMLSLAGVEVTLVSYGADADFARLPYKDGVTVKGGGNTAPLTVDYASIDLTKQEQLSQMRQSQQRVSGLVKRLDTTAAGIFEDFMTDRKTRVVRSGGVFTEDGEIPVYSAALIGCDEDAAYTNMLVKFKESFAGSKKQLIFIEKPLENPNAEEVKALGAVTAASTDGMIDALALLIKLNGDPTRTALAQAALKEVLQSLNTGNRTLVFNYGSKLVTWLYRCTQARRYSVQYEDIPVVLYYGDISQSEVCFLSFMSRCGFDVIYITPDKHNADIVRQKDPGGRLQIFELAGSKESGKYPDKPVKMKAATVAYNAERELDTVLYGGDTGIYRSFQFPNSQSLTLRTTFEEIGILWKEQAKFRSGFAAAGNLVTVPNIFAKISGVPDGNMNAYWDMVRARLTPETVLKVNAPAQQQATPDLSAYRSFYRNGEINTEKLKASTLNKYSYLPDRIQDMLFFKMQEAVNSGFLKLEGDELMFAVLHYGMSFDKELLRLIQGFDFTKEIPKLVYIDAVEDVFTLEECVRIVLCSLIGFDVLIFTPTGYRNIEAFVKPEAYEEHVMDEFAYNVEVPKLKVPAEEKSGGFFSKLFRK